MAEHEYLRCDPGALDLAVTFQKEGREYVRIHADGRVVIAEGVELDDAARAFWEAVQRIASGEAAGDA